MVFKGLIPSKSICSLNLQINKFSKLCIFWEKVCLWLYEKFVPGMMRMALLKSFPNFQRLDMDIPVLLFLSIRWGQKKEISKKTCEGLSCGWRTRGLKHKFLRAHAPPWGFVVDSGGLSSWDSLPSARLCRGRQHEGDWRKTWASWWQYWGEGWESYVFTFTLFSFSAFCPSKTKLQSCYCINHYLIGVLMNFYHPFKGSWVPAWTSRPLGGNRKPSR